MNLKEGSALLRVSQKGNGAVPLVLSNIKAPKNGYAFVYISNDANEPVYFDNLQVGLNRGRIIEEDHYYAYGLKIAAISSVKLGDANEGSLTNKNLYNDKEFFDDGDLDWYNYGFRDYDPQIGRFVQLDPLTWDYPELTNYQYASDEPIANVDEDGLEALSSVQNIANGFTSVGRNLTEVTIKSAAKVVTQTAKSATNLTARLVTIGLEGTRDALFNANTLGIYDAVSGNQLKNYHSPDEKAAYLNGRLRGDAMALVMGTHEMEIGGGAALATGVETVGVGAVIGGGVAAHGAISSAVATKDAAWAAMKLYKLNQRNQIVYANDARNEGEIGPYKELAKTPQGETNLEVHHLIEKRFRKLFGEKAGDMISKILDKGDHQEFTNHWRSLIKYGRKGTGLAKKEDVIRAAKEIYKDHPDILKALEPYFK